MKTTDRLNVMYHGRKVGTMALYKGHLAAFEYDREWIAEGFSISPFYLPLEQKFLFRRRTRLMGFLEYLRTVSRMAGEGFWLTASC